MQTDIVAMTYLIASQLIISLVFFVISLRLGRLALATMLTHIDNRIIMITNQMYEKIDEKIQMTLDAVGEQFSEILTQPTVSKAFGIIGSQGGQATAEIGLTNKIAMDVLNGPKFAGLKIAAEAFGMNLDEYIEGHGAVNTLHSIRSLAGMIPGFDLGSLLKGGGDASVGFEANGGHPLLDRR